MTGHLLNAIRAAAFFSIIIVAFARGCNHQRSTPEAPTVTNKVSKALIGKQMTIRGRFSLRCKVGACIGLDNQQVIYLIASTSFTWGKPYSEMEDKFVTVTGVLRFFHDNEPADPPGAPQRARLPDYFYFEAETAQVRLVSQ